MTHESQQKIHMLGRFSCTLPARTCPFGTGGHLAPGNRGFTLMEIMLYVGLAAIIIVGGSVFLSTSLSSQERNDITVEVDTQAIQTLQTITQVLRNAEDADVIIE